MAFRLTAEELADKKKHQNNLARHRDTVETELTKLNEKIDALVAEYNKTFIIPYNGAVDEATKFAEDVGARLREEFDNKSEAWQESEKGQACDDFAAQWENIEFEGFEAIENSPIEYGGRSWPDEEIDDLPDEADA